MSTKNTLTTGTAQATPTAVLAGPALRIMEVVGSHAIKSDAARRASEKVLASGLLAWLATQPDNVREDIFVAVEGTLSIADSRKLEIHPLRPQIAADRIEVVRAQRERQRDEARRAREAEKKAAKRARYESLRAEFETAAPEDEDQGQD